MNLIFFGDIGLPPFSFARDTGIGILLGTGSLGGGTFSASTSLGSTEPTPEPEPDTSEETLRDFNGMLKEKLYYNYVMLVDFLLLEYLSVLFCVAACLSASSSSIIIWRNMGSAT